MEIMAHHYIYIARRTKKMATTPIKRTMTNIQGKERSTSKR
jgi:hypothetical protein